MSGLVPIHFGLDSDNELRFRCKVKRMIHFLYQTDKGYVKMIQ